MSKLDRQTTLFYCLYEKKVEMKPPDSLKMIPNSSSSRRQINTQSFTNIHNR